jgi:hypothetical protein
MLLKLSDFVCLDLPYFVVAPWRRGLENYIRTLVTSKNGISISSHNHKTSTTITTCFIKSNKRFNHFKSLTISHKTKVTMRSSAIPALLAAFLTGASAIITGFTVPSAIALGQTFTVTLNTADYIQRVTDISAAFGIQPVPGAPGAIGDLFDSIYIGPAESNILQPITFETSIDPSTQAGAYIMTGAVTSLYGVGSEPVINLFNATVTVGAGVSAVNVTSN